MRVEFVDSGGRYDQFNRVGKRGRGGKLDHFSKYERSDRAGDPYRAVGVGCDESAAFKPRFAKETGGGYSP